MHFGVAGEKVNVVVSFLNLKEVPYISDENFKKLCHNVNEKKNAK